MNKTFQTITSILIILLLFLLMWVFISYYTSPVESKEVIYNVNTNIPSPNIQVPTNPDLIDRDLSHESSTKADEKNQSTPTVTDIIKETEPESKVIISSNSETSNAEKQQVLNEIDEALSELLLVVDSVTVVDETRLGIDEGVEVQP